MTRETKKEQGIKQGKGERIPEQCWRWGSGVMKARETVCCNDLGKWRGAGV